MTRAFVVVAILALGAVHVARADDPAGSPMAEAGKHFERGVSLYDEADYRSALVEFKRAYEIAPNAVVLYNIGETYYQLQNYALALTTLERFIAEAPETAQHRDEVKKTIETLKTRVGKVDITTNVPGCEITIDDDYVGKTPLPGAVPLSIGHRKITALHTGLTPDTRFVDVAAGDTVKAQLVLVDPNAGAGTKPPDAPSPPPIAPVETAPHGSNAATIGWITTGALAAGGITFGVLAVVESRDLKDARGKFGATAADLDGKASRVKTFGIVGDALGVAAVIAGGISLKLTLSKSSSHEVTAQLAPTGIVIGGNFR